MTATLTADCNSMTIHLEDGQQVYPCRCGETHRGEYAMEDFAHHNCLHEEKLLDWSDHGGGERGLLCPQCGQGFISGPKGVAA